MKLYEVEFLFFGPGAMWQNWTGGLFLRGWNHQMISMSMVHLGLFFGFKDQKLMCQEMCWVFKYILELQVNVKHVL